MNANRFEPMRPILPIAIASAACIVALGIGIVYATVPGMAHAGRDDRNGHVTMVPYLRWGVDPSTLVVDIWSVDLARTSMADVDRELLDIAEGLKDRTFSTVQLAHQGRIRYQMAGDYFKRLGEERAFQNPIYTVRTLPENMLDPDGARAFSQWSGGFIGVVAEQMKDHEKLHLNWYIQ